MLTKFSDRLSHIWHIVSSIALVVMMLVVVADVALRFLFNLPVRGAYDIVSVCLLVMVLDYNLLNPTKYDQLTHIQFYHPDIHVASCLINYIHV